MTVSSTATRIAYTGNGVTTAFAFSWRFLATSEIKVYVNDVLQSTGYSVSAPGSSGTVTFSSAPANGAKIVIRRETALTQNIDYVANDPFAADVTEGGFDRAMLAAQDNAAAIGRALRVADHAPAVTALDLSNRAGQMLVVNSDGTGFDFGTALTSTQATNPKTIVVLGSSNGAGVGSSTYAADPVSPYTSEPATSWVGLLRAALGSSWTIYNRSITGTNTASSIARFWTDVAPYRPSHVILATGFHNEGYVTPTYIRGLAELVRLCDLIGAVPIIRGPSPYNSATAGNLSSMLDAARQIDAMGRWQIDALSTLLDESNGHFAGGSTYHAGDGIHLNDAGHMACFQAIDLGMFNYGALAPKRSRTKGAWRVNAAATDGNAILIDTSRGLSQPLRSFTMRARIGGLTSGGGTGKAFLAAYINGLNAGVSANAPLRLRNPFSVYDFANAGDIVATSTVDPTADARWHDCVIVYKHALNTAYLYIDGVLIGSGTLSTTTQASEYFVFGSRVTGDIPGPAVSYRFSDCQLWSTPLTAEQIADMHRTNIPPLAGLLFDAILSNTPRTWCQNAIENGLLPVLGVTWDIVPVDPKSGLASGTTDGSGDLTVTHGLGETPNYVKAAPQGTTFAQVQAHTIGSTTFKLRFLDAAGSAMTASSRSAAWECSL